ncbi:MAG: hypothetical protein JWN79_2136 [Gemmatimonadetes bacterium]|jgi:uncharacterized repeat protein (TIGR01451 family)|nr:hypothetical protein [Gemmatimonadota bacterium]
MRTRGLRAPWVLLAGMACLLAPASARAQGSFADTTLFAVNNTTTLYTVNRLSGTSTAVGALLFSTSALACDPSTGRLYYTSTNAALPVGRVAYWDPATGTNTLLNGTGLNDAGLNDNVERLAFSTGGVLYGIGATSATLYTISPTTGAYTSLGTVRIGSSAGAPLGGGGDIAFDYDGTLYASALDASNQTILYGVSLALTGGAFVATPAGMIVNTVQGGLAFVADGRLYSAGLNQNIYAVNKSSGAPTFITGGTIAIHDFATLPRFANLGITGSTTGLPRGDTAAFSITVSNAGPQYANGPITVLDTLPAGLTYLRMTGSGWTCSAAGQVVTCVTPGPLAASAASTLVIYTTVATLRAGRVLTSILRVTGSTIDQDQTGDRITVAGTVVVDVDFVLTKSHAGNFIAGQNGVYTIAFTNTGVAASTGTITMVDTLPTGLAWVSATGTAWTCSKAGTAPEIVTCTRTTAVNSGASTSIALTVAATMAATPSRTNTAWVSGGGTLTATAASDPTTIDYYAVAVTPDLAPVSQLPSNGTSYTATFTVGNAGTLADTYTLVASRVPGTSIAITSVRGVSGTSGGSVPVATNGSVQVAVVYTVLAAASAGATDTLKLLATSLANGTVRDYGSVIVNVVKAGLTITKALYRADGTTLVTAGGQVSIGETVQFLVTVKATGSVPSTTVKVSDVLPAGVSFLGATPDAAGWTLAEAGGTVTGNLTGTLAVGASRFFWIQVKVK